MEVSIKVQNLSKSYVLGGKPTELLQHYLLSKQALERFVAVKGADFEIYKGQTVGIVGQNGSGKSTLLQLIAGVLLASEGDIEVSGRVVALLELGSGFNPEFTGRENVLFNASILGLTEDEIDARFEEIVAFADIGAFIEMPVKTYSSGMMLRLAFAVSIHVDPEILIIDEALAVGDHAFQRKCYSKLKQLQAKGVTILIVSHGAASIIELCDRALLMDAGEVIFDGEPKEVVNYYHKLLFMPTVAEREQFRSALLKDDLEAQADSFGSVAAASNSALEKEDRAFYDESLNTSNEVWYAQNGAEISNVRILSAEGVRVNVLTSGLSYSVCYDVSFEQEAYEVTFGTLIKTTSGVELGGANTANNVAHRLAQVMPGDRFTVRYGFQCLFRDGVYFLNCGCTGVVEGKHVFLHRGVDVLMMKVIEENRDAFGYVDIQPEFSCSKIS